MYSIDRMMEEHVNIRRMMAVMAASLKEGTIDCDEWMQMVSFLQNYADAHHHGKEEDILFPEMIQSIGGMVEGIIEGVMLVEHEEGRKYVQGLIEGIEAYRKEPSDAHWNQIEWNANGYIQLLSEHTEKEDQVLYQIALMHLNEEAKADVDRRCRKKEEQEAQSGVQEQHVSFLVRMEEKYQIVSK